jgi:hypothetical protein
VRLATSACQGGGEVALGLLEGLLGNLRRGGAHARGMRRLARPAGGSARRGVPARRTLLPTAPLLVALALLSGPMSAQASEASTIVEKCAHGQPIGGYSQSAYRQALKQLPTILIEYSPCTEQIRGAELAAAGGGAGGTSTGTAPNVPLALTPTEQRAIQSAHHNGATPVRVGSEPIRPGVVHANIASAVNTLPHSLFAVLAFLLAGAVVLAIGEVRKRVRTYRDG